MTATQTAPYPSVDLAPLTTFGVPAQAEYYAEVKSVKELNEALMWGKQQGVPMLALGGGSNMIFLDDFEGLVIHPQIEGIEILDEDETSVTLQVGSGMNWHQLVVWTVEQGYQGIENLALIPGSVGAAPIQNIGAYGVELVDVFKELTAIHGDNGKTRVFSKNDCQFGYRDSVFKQSDQKGRWLIAQVTLILQKSGTPNTSYRSLRQWMEERDIPEPTPRQVMEAVIQIRQSKLPDPREIGNAGSFFKNPVVDPATAERIRKEYPKMPSYNIKEQHVKIPAGWLIEQAGWKGKTQGSVGCFENQALVLVNRGGATGTDVVRFARNIRQSVHKQFGIRLETEVNLVDKQGYTTL